MSSNEEALHDQLNDDIEPTNSKKIKLSTDVQDAPLHTTMTAAQSKSSPLDREILVADLDDIISEQETSKKVDATVSIDDRKKVSDEEELQQMDKSPTASATSANAQVDNRGHESQLVDQVHTLQTSANQNQDSVNTVSVVAPLSDLTPSKVIQPPLLTSPDEKRREALKGIVMGIKSPVMKSEIETCGTKDILLDGSSQESKMRSPPNKTLSDSTMNELSEVTETKVKRRAPRKDPKPRMPLEHRVFHSKKEVDSASAFLVDKVDLCDLLPLDDCFMLGEMFWIFTVKQLELALDETPGRSPPNFVEEMIAKFSRTPSSLSTKATPQGIVESSVTIEASEHDRINSINGENASERKESSQVILSPLNDQHTNTTTENKGPNDESSLVSPLCDIRGSTDTENVKGTDNQTALPDSQTVDSKGNKETRCDEPPYSDTSTTPVEPQVDGTNGPLPLTEFSLDRSVMIKERIDFWRKALESFRGGGTKTKELQIRFQLDGPIKILFPQATRNFFKSIQLEYLWAFLGLRKSETGAICDLMYIWRRECKLSVIPDIGLGRHFLAIAARVETVLNAFPPIPENDRGWILDPISGITGAARDFLIRDHKIMSGAEFLDLKTKQLADVLELWRHDNGMDKLRGSGKVAMISAWKACIKEALEVESDVGKVLDLSGFVAKVQNEKYSSTTNEKYPSTIGRGKPKYLETVSKKTSVNEGTSDLALYSKMALERVLGEGATALLRSGGVQTAAELFDVDTSPESQLYKTLIETGIVDGIQAFIKAVEKWREMMRQYLSKLPVRRESTSATASGSKALLSPTENAVSPVISCETSTVKRNLITDSAIARPKKSSQTVQKSSGDLVYDVLSHTTKQFLASMGIFTAKAFLKTRSSTLAINFVPWRRSMGKPELKGVGSIASISGWKSQIRKKAKEVGFDELAELEPPMKGTKKNQHPHTYSDEEVLDTDVLDTALVVEDEIDSSRYSERMATSNRELFAVQHLDIDCQSVFELSLRQGRILPEQLFITFKGVAFRKSSTIAESLKIKISSINRQNTATEQLAWILPDVPVSSRRWGKIPWNNDGSSVSFTSPLHVGLIDISLHGAHPYQDQNLDLLILAMERFIVQGHLVKVKGFDGNSDEMYNVVIRKIRLDTFHYLLHFHMPVEQGHAMKIIFPSIATAFHVNSHMNSDYSIMHKFDESFMTMSVADLQKLTTWLHNKVHAMPSVGENDRKTKMHAEARVHRRRMYWLERRLFAAVKHWMKSNECGDEMPLNSELFVHKYFCADKELIVNSTQQKKESTDAMTAQIVTELKYALELDLTCGLEGRLGWNPAANKFFDDVILCIAECISHSYSEKLEWSPLLNLIKSAICSGETAQQSKNIDLTIILQDGHDGQMDIAAESTEVARSNRIVPDSEPSLVISPMDVDAESAEVAQSDHILPDVEPSLVTSQMDIDADFAEVAQSDRILADAEPSLVIWQVVNSVFDALRMDLFVKKDSDSLSNALSAVHSILFDIDTIVPDPILIRYDHELSYVSPLLRADIDYMPDTKMLFLGLIWPVLRKCGWRVDIGSSPSEISFIPKSVSHKRRNEFKLLRLRQRVKLDCDLKNAGFNRIPKMAKRLLLSIVTDSDSEVWIDVIPEKKYSVETVLEKFQAFLFGRFSKLKDFSRFKVNDLIRNVVIAIGDCFDHCASMLAPISNLTPSSNSNGESMIRPITTYRCEYLIPFLINFLPIAGFKSDSNMDDGVVDDVVQELACDLLVYLSENHHEFFNQRFHPPSENYVEDPSPTLWIERHVRSLLTEHALVDNPTSNATSVSINDSKGRNGINDEESFTVSPEVELFEILLDDETFLVTDFIRTILENAKPLVSTGTNARRLNSRPIGAPGLVCRHCLGQNGEGKYFFSSMESLSSCYSVLEKHYYKCPDTPTAMKMEITNARALHIQQRRLKPFGAQQAVFVKLWDRMVQCTPDTTKLQKLSGANNDDEPNNDKDDTDETIERSTTPMDDGDDELVFTDHRAVIDYLRTNDSRQLLGTNKTNSSSVSSNKNHRTFSQSNKQAINEALDTYYACIEYAGRIYGTSSMPPRHFSTQWILNKMNIGRHLDYGAETTFSKHYIG